MDDARDTFHVDRDEDAVAGASRLGGRQSLPILAADPLLPEHPFPWKLLDAFAYTGPWGS